MITNPVYTAPNRVTCVPMFEGILVATINDPTSNPVSVVVGGATYTSGDNLTLTARGTNICWTGYINLSLTANTRYPWSVTQGSNSDAGSYYHTPAQHTDFRLHAVSCDNNTVFSNAGNAEPHNVIGHWQYMKQDYDSGSEIAGMVVIDDDGYVYTCIVKDDGSGSYDAATGLVNTGTQGDLDFYLIAWCATLGMLGLDRTTYTDEELANKDLLQILWGREENRAFCRKHINRIHCGQSDWDSGGDMGWDDEPLTAFTNGTAAYNMFYGLGQPDISDLITKTDASAGHWVAGFGDLCLGNLDYITNSTRTWGSNVIYGTSAQLTQFTTLFGNAQIDDYLNAVDACDRPFSIMLTQWGTRYAVARTDVSAPYITFTDSVTERDYNAQHPLFDHCLADYQRLYTSTSGVSSIMDNPKTNGSLGTFMMLGGDLHLFNAASHSHPAYTGNYAENFWQINIATINNSQMASPAAVTGADIANMHIEYTQDDVSQFYGCFLDVVGTSSPKQVILKAQDKDNTEILAKQFVVGRGGNEGYDLDINVLGVPASVVAE